MNNKQLGAKEMFSQSIVYLFNSYREGGYTPAQAKEQVAKDVEELYKKYTDDAGFPEVKFGVADPHRHIDDMLSHIRQFDLTMFAAMNSGAQDRALRQHFAAFTKHLHQLKKILKK